MTQNYLEVGVTVEEARKHEPQRMDSRLGAETPWAAGQELKAAIGTELVRCRDARVKVQRDLELFDRCPKRLTLRLVEILDAVRVANVGVAVDEDSHRTQLSHGSGGFGRGGLRALQRHTREGPETIGMLTSDVDLVNFVVDSTREVNCRVRIKDALNTGHRQRHHRVCHTGLIHRLHAQLEVGQPTLNVLVVLPAGVCELTPRFAGGYRGRRVENRRRHGLFQSDLPRVPAIRHRERRPIVVVAHSEFPPFCWSPSALLPVSGNVSDMMASSFEWIGLPLKASRRFGGSTTGARR